MKNLQPAFDYQQIPSSELYARLSVLRLEVDALVSEVEHRRLTAEDKDHKRRGNACWDGRTPGSAPPPRIVI